MIGKEKGKLERLVEKREEDVIWLVSYADMMTLLFGFFVILFIFSQVDQRKLSEFGREITKTFGEVSPQKTEKGGAEAGVMTETRQLRALQLLVAVLNLGDNVENAIQNVEKRLSNAQSATAAKEMLVDHIKNQSLAGYEVLKGAKDPDDIMEISIPVNTLFTSGSDVLAEDAKKKVKTLSKALSSVRGLVGIEVIGHTDSAPPKGSGLFQNNWALSSARAGAVAQELVNQGFDRKQIRVSGMSDLKPLFPEKNPDGSWNLDNMAKNRRVHIILKRSKNFVSQ